MKEPSVLDYLKSRLNPWQSEKVEIPGTETPTPGFDETPPAQTGGTPETAPKSRDLLALPWRTFLALTLALVGQFVLEPPDRSINVALVFYALAFALLLWAYFTNEFFLPALPEDEPVTDPQTARRRWIIAALVLACFAFLFFGSNPLLPRPPDGSQPVSFWFNSNLFTPLNVTLWLAALAVFLRSLWLYGTYQQAPSAEGEEPKTKPDRPFSLLNLVPGWWDVGLLLALAFCGAWGLGGNIYLYGLLPLLIAFMIIWLRDTHGLTPGQHIRAFFTRDSWQIKYTRWTLLILAVCALVIFFRFYRLDGVPAEPFSDHAEKLLDVYDITQGQTHVFFERNTGREFIQFYWTALLAFLLNTGLTFISLKIGTVLIGLLALPYVYLLGKEIGGKRVALFALILAGVAYWPNTISRIGLRFPLYTLFTAPVLFYLIRGLRTQKRNDFILCGLFLGLGLHGYSPFRVVPFVVVAAVGLYLLHKPSKGRRKQVLMLVAIVVVASFLVFLPLFRFAVERPDLFSERAMTRMTGIEKPLPTPSWCPLPGDSGAIICVFSSNTYSAMMMSNWDNGDTWVHSVIHRPALDIAAAVLFAFGYILLVVRYIRQRRWQDIVLLVSLPLLLMPSILSLAYPNENPSLNRTSGALVVDFVIAAMALDGLYTALLGAASRPARLRQGFALGVVIFLLGMSTFQSYDLVFNQFDKQFRTGSWNTADMGRIIRAFIAAGNSPDNVWVVPFPYWADTRLAGIQAGLPTRDLAKWPDDLPQTLPFNGAKLFLVKDEDTQGLTVLRNLYPAGLLGKFDSPLDGHDFWIYTVPDNSQAVAP